MTVDWNARIKDKILAGLVVHFFNPAQTQRQRKGDLCALKAGSVYIATSRPASQSCMCKMILGR